MRHKQDITVLIVEDEQDSIEMLSKILGYNNITYKIATTGQACLDKLEEIEADVVVMDLVLPGKLDGWQTLVQMRTDLDTAHIPVIAITAYHSANVADEALHAGFNAYLPKPIDSTVFIEELDRALNYSSA